MALNLKQYRLRAYALQGGQCFYCGLPICEGDIKQFQSEFGSTAREAKSLFSTAEHLVARKDGGTNGNSNVVAACWTCNQSRHRRKNVNLSWEQFRDLVCRRMQQGKWRARSLLRKVRKGEALAEASERAVIAHNSRLMVANFAKGPNASIEADWSVAVARKCGLRNSASALGSA